MKLTGAKSRSADTLWRDKVRSLFNNKDAITKESEPANPTELTMFHCHHILGRSPWHRWRIENGILLSPENHRFVHESANGRAWLEAAIKSRFPAWWGLILKMKQIPPAPFKEHHLEEAITTLKELDIEAI